MVTKVSLGLIVESPDQPLRNPRHESFACCIAEGGKPVNQCFVEAGYSRKQKSTVYPYQLADNPTIAARVRYLREQVQSQMYLTISDKRKTLAEIARKGQLNKDKIAAIQLDAKLAGELDERPITNVLICGEDRLMRLAQLGQQAQIEAQSRLLDAPTEPDLP